VSGGVVREIPLIQVNPKENGNPPEVTGTRLAPGGLPAPEDFDAHPQFLGAVLPILLQFQPLNPDLLPKG
jgi:hypothetical protein